MRPTTVNRDNDDTFMSLLSNQRKLLKQIQQETKDSYSSASALSSSHPHPHQLQPSQNCGIFITRTTIPGMSCQNNAPIFPPQYHHHPTGNTNESAFHLVHSQKPHLPLHHQSPHPSNILFLSPSPNLPPQMPPMTSTNWPQQSTRTTSYQDLLEEYLLESNTPLLRMKKTSFNLGLSSADTHDEYREEPPLIAIIQSPKKNRKINPKVQKLADALEKSAQSQQEIHHWDRNMGLKRSHSKTMTQSMQSRKKLRGVLDNIFRPSKIVRFQTSGNYSNTLPI